jgi:hypothetical protein
MRVITEQLPQSRIVRVPGEPPDLDGVRKNEEGKVSQVWRVLQSPYPPVRHRLQCLLADAPAATKSLRSALWGAPTSATTSVVTYRKTRDPARSGLKNRAPIALFHVM